MRILNDYDKKVINAIISAGKNKYTFSISDIIVILFNGSYQFEILENKGRKIEEGFRSFRFLITAVGNSDIVDFIYIDLANLKSSIDYLISENLIYIVGTTNFDKLQVNDFSDEDKSKNVWAVHDSVRYQLFCLLSNTYRVTENLIDLQVHRFKFIDERKRETDLKIQILNFIIALAALIVGIIALLK